MSLKDDMEHGVFSGADNFHAQLLRIMMKADSGNLGRLSRAFPHTAKVLSAWKAGESIPDLPYEE